MQARGTDDEEVRNSGKQKKSDNSAIGKVSHVFTISYEQYKKYGR